MPKKTVKKEPEKKERPKLERIGALWLKSGQTGNRFMSGVINIDENNSIKVLVFKNGYKEESKHPDYVIYDASGDKERTSDDDVPF